MADADPIPVAAEAAAGGGPLAGIRVLDFTTVMAGPFCTRLLADMGAEVIKLEPETGDQIRERTPVRDGHSTYFGTLNAGKKSISADLKNPDALRAVKAIAARSDVVVENFRPGVMNRFGLGYDVLAADNPGLVFCAISGFGQTGPAAKNPAYAPILHAASGYDMAHMRYQPGAGRPAHTGIFMADVLGGIYALSAINAALFSRERTGRGQFIDVALMDAMLSMLVYEVQEAQFPSTRLRPLYKPLVTSDGYVIVAPVSQRIFVRMCAALGQPELVSDPLFADVGNREQNWDALMDVVEAWTRPRTSREAEDALSAAGVPCSRYLTPAEALAQPQLAHRGSIAAIADAAGPFNVVNPPFQMSGTPVGARGFVPGLGRDTDSVLRDIAGLSQHDIDALRASGGVC